MLALGRAQFAARDYDHAATTLAKVPLNDRRALEARFFLGLARMNSAKYADAEQAFAFVASRLPLPEVINNQAVAVSRQGRDAAALFQRVVAADPNDPDYHFNLAVALFRRGDRTGALREIDAALRLRSGDAEAQQLHDVIAQGNSAAPVSGGSTTVGDAAFSPVERIRRTYTEASFRQAAFQLDQMQQLRLATLKPAERATEYTQQGQQYLAEGLLPEAEQEFQLAISSDPADPLARAALAQVREESGSDADARTEAQTSLQLHPNVPAYLVLARLDLKSNQLPDAAQAVSSALRLEPKDPASLAMRQTLVSRGSPSREPVRAQARTCARSRVELQHGRCRHIRRPASDLSGVQSARPRAPGATGLLFVLLGLHSLSLLHLRPVAVLLVVVAFALLALPLRHASVWLCSLTGTALLVLGLARLSAPETWSATAAAYGLVLGPLTGWLANVAGRARRAKRDLRPSLSQRRPAPLSSGWE